jgi:hypothetical protein
VIPDREIIGVAVDEFEEEHGTLSQPDAEGLHIIRGIEVSFRGKAVRELGTVEAIPQDFLNKASWGVLMHLRSARKLLASSSV